MQTTIVLDLLHDNPYQPRLVDDPAHIEALARSIAADGLQQLPKARKVEVWYQLAFGHSRRKAFEWLAANYKAQGLPDRYDGYTCMPVEIEEMDEETMYRLAVTENVQRKDLDPIEQAKSMKVYRDQFGKTSTEIGALFGMSDATVRGLVRLLDLPEAVQAVLSRGEISQGTARTLLAVQKITTEKEMLDLLKKIKDEEGESLPDEVIARHINHRQNTYDMWSSVREGKPRSDWRNGWLLDMKNFPNNFLTHIAPGDLVDMGLVKSSELKKAHTDFCLGVVDADIPEALKETITFLSNPPACKDCPYYAKVHGDHFCGMKTCHTRKSAAWVANKIHMTSKELKIAAYQVRDGKYKILDHHDGAQKKMFTARHADLRLIAKGDVKSYSWQSLEGVDDDMMFVVIVGDALKQVEADAKAARAANRAQVNAVDEAQTPEQAFSNSIDKIWDTFTWQASAKLSTCFQSVPDAVMLRIHDMSDLIGNDLADEYKPKDDYTPEYAAYLRRAMVIDILDHVRSYGKLHLCKSAAEVLAYMHEVAAPFGPIFSPLDDFLDRMAAQFDAEFAAAVAVETPAKKTTKRS